MSSMGGGATPSPADAAMALLSMAANPDATKQNIVAMQEAQRALETEDAKAAAHAAQIAADRKAIEDTHAAHKVLLQEIDTKRAELDRHSAHLAQREAASAKREQDSTAAAQSSQRAIADAESHAQAIMQQATEKLAEANAAVESARKKQAELDALIATHRKIVENYRRAANADVI